MSVQPGENDPAGRRPARPAFWTGRDRRQSASDPRTTPPTRFGRRLNGANQILWTFGRGDSRTGDIVAHLREVHAPLPNAGPYNPDIPIGPDGRPRGERFFDEGVSDLFPSGTPVDWVSWAAVENQIAAQIQRGNEVRLTTRAVQDPGTQQVSAALQVSVYDPRTGQVAQYPFASLAQYAAARYLGTARTPGAPQPGRTPSPQQQPLTQQPPDPSQQPTQQLPVAQPLAQQPPDSSQQPTQQLPTQQPPDPSQQPTQQLPTQQPVPGTTQPLPTQPIQPVQHSGGVGQPQPTQPLQPPQPPQPVQQGGVTQPLPTQPLPVPQPGQPGQQGGPTWWTPNQGAGGPQPQPPQPIQGPPMQGPPMQGPRMQGPRMQGPPMQGPPMQGPPQQQQPQQQQPQLTVAQVQAQQLQARAAREAFARGVLGTAFGVVAPEAVPLQDGGVRLNDEGDVVERATLERMTAQLAERAEQQASPPRMLAEAVAMVGDHAARMAGEAPADGATEALGMLLDVPFLPEQNRVEAQAVLGSVFAATAEPPPRGDEPPRMSQVVGSAEEIGRDVRMLGVTGTTTAPLPVPGAQRPAVGSRHRRDDRTVGVPAVRGTELTARGRPSGVAELTPGEAIAAGGALTGTALGGRVQGDPAVQGGYLVVDTPNGPQHFTVEIGSPGRRRAAAVDVRAGSLSEPHVVTMPPRLSADALRPVWVGAISSALQQQEASRSGHTGILSRVHDTFSGATRNRTAEAQNAQFRLLARDWQDNRAYYDQYGLPQTADRLDALQRDLIGLTNVMDRAPVVPWQPGAVPVNAVPARTPQTPGARGSMVASLRNRVGAEIERLEAAATYLDDCKTGKEDSAATARGVADTKHDEAVAEAELKDSLAPERARKLEVESRDARDQQERHERIAVTYGEAAGQAKAAAATYRDVLTELDALAADPNRPLDQVRDLAAKADGETRASQERFGAALPPDSVMPSGVAVGRLPHTNALTRHCNTWLDEHGDGKPFRFNPATQHQMMRANFGQLVGDGLILKAGDVSGDDASKQAEFKVKLVMPDRYDATGTAPTHSEMIVGQLDQRNHTVATTVTRSRTVKSKYGLKGLLQAIPGSGVVKAIAEAVAVVAPRVELSGKRAGTLTATSAENGRRASVEAIRGETVTVSSNAPVLMVWQRSSPFEEWSEPTTIDTSGPDDSQSAAVRLSHAYTVPAPESKDLTDINKEGAAHQRVTQMPEHMASYVGKMNEIGDEAAVKLKKMLGRVDPVAYGQLRSMINEWPGRLDETLVPGGIGRTIVNRGRPACWVTMESRWVPGSVKMVGQRSTAHWTERVRVGIATSGISQSVATSGDKGLAGGYDFDGIGPTEGTLGPGAGVARGRGRDEGIGTSTTNYEVGVERVEDTVGVGGHMEHVMVVRELGSNKSFEVSRTGEVLLRMAETDAFRYGFPVPREAVVREPDGTPKYHPVDGRILLRGDPQPAGKDVVVPHWMGAGELQLRGKGPGQAGVVTGIDTVGTLRALEADGILPPLDANLQPDLSRLPGDYDQELLTSQLENLERARQGISGMRAGTQFDQATQGGVTVPLELRRSGVAHAPERFVLDLRIDQTFDHPKPQVLGINPSVKGLYLDISSATSSQTANRSQSVKGSVSLGIRGADELGGMDFPKIGPGVNGELGSNQGLAVGVTSNRVGLREPGRSVSIRVHHSTRVRLHSRGGATKSIASGTGYADMLVGEEQCRPAPAQEFYAIRGEVSKDVMDKAFLIHADGGKDMLDRLWDAMPPATKADPTAYHQLAAFTDIRSLVADQEWLRKEHRVRLLSPAADSVALAAEQFSLKPSDVSVELKARVVGLERISPPGSPVSGRINLTLTSTGTTSGTSRVGGAGVSAGAGAPDPGAAVGASADVGRGVTNSQSRSATRIGGAETLGIETGAHDDFRARIVWEAEVKHNGKSRVVPLNDGAALMSIPERQLLTLYAERKLELPVERTADSVERFLNGRLKLDRRVAHGLIRRYREDKQGVTGGLVDEHSDLRLAAGLRVAAGIDPPTTVVPDSQELDEALKRTKELSDQVVVTPLPEAAMDLAILDELTLTDPQQPNRQADVLGDLKALIDRQSPGRLKGDGALADALSGELEGDRWYGHRGRIWSPRGHVREYSVKGSELGPPKRIRVRIRGAWTGPPTTDGHPEPATQQALNILQRYLYLNSSQARTRSVNYTGSLNINGDAAFGLNDPTAGVGTHRVHTVRADVSQTLTGMSRLSVPETAHVDRPYMLWIEVEELPAPRTLRDRLQRNLNRPEPVPKVGIVLTGEMKLLVPRDLVGYSAPDQTPAIYRQADHRAVQLPGNPIFPGTMQPYLSGEQPTDHLWNALSERMARRDLMGEAGFAAHRTGLEDDVSTEQLQSWFKMVMSEGGYTINERDVPGKRYKVGATVRGRLYDLALVSPPLKGVEIGEIHRDEIDAQNSFTGNRATPLTRTVGASPLPDFGVSVTTGEQVTDKVTDLSGSRVERSMFIKPENAVVVRMRYNLDVDYTKRGLNSKGEPKVVDSQTNAADGEVWVTMDYQDYLSMRAQMESGAAVTQPPSARKLDVRRVAADELTAGPNGPAYHPYRPLVAALDQARQEGVMVSLTVRRPDGSRATYEAGPEGTLTGGGDDKFAAAFASLRPHLALLAEGRVNLYQLHQAQQNQQGPQAQEPFTKTVSNALKAWGVEPAIVDEAAHSVAAPPAARVAASPGHPDGARQQVGTTYSPGPTGHSGMSVS